MPYAAAWPNEISLAYPTMRSRLIANRPRISASVSSVIR